MQERWQHIQDFEGYSISDHGRVCNLRRDSILTPSINRQGILKISLYDNALGKPTTRSIGLLVAEAFLDRIGPKFDTPIHLDGDRTNCHIDNLLWRPRWFAVKYHQQFFIERFRFDKRHFEDVDTGEEYQDFVEPCTKFGLIHNTVIYSYLNNRRIFPTDQQFRLLEN